jgi:hypothetical protein
MQTLDRISIDLLARLLSTARLRSNLAVVTVPKEMGRCSALV